MPGLLEKKRSGALGRIEEKYPVMKGHPWSVIDSKGKSSKHGGQLEFYPPDEKYNPLPGRATIEVFNEDLKGPALDKAVFGDMLHYMPQVDERFRDTREQYRRSQTMQQYNMDLNAYQRGVKEYGESRPYADWYERSRLDAHLRGYLAPDADNNWAGAYTPEQTELLQGLLNYLEGK